MVLEDVCELIADCPHTTAPDEGKGYPLIRTPNVGKGRLLLEGVHRVSKDIYDKRNMRAIPQKDDIIFAREAPAGNAALIREGQEVCLGQRTVLIRPDCEKVFPEYLVYYLLAPEQQDKLLGTANGATVAHVNLPVIRKMPIELPDIDVQQKIAGYISIYDDLIENNQRQIKLLEEAAQRLYKEWFVDFKFPEYEKVSIKDNVPEEWTKERIDSRIELLSGYAFKSTEFDSSGEYKIVTIKNVKDGQFDGDNVSRIIEIPDRMPEHCKLGNGDILLSLTGNVGRVCIVNGEKYLLNQRVAKLKSDMPAFTYCLFRSRDLFVEMNNLANGAAQQNLSPIRTGKIEVLFPTKGLISLFEKNVQPMIDRIIVLNKEIVKLKKTRDVILPKLMSGKIEV